MPISRPALAKPLESSFSRLLGRFLVFGNPQKLLFPRKSSHRGYNYYYEYVLEPANIFEFWSNQQSIKKKIWDQRRLKTDDDDIFQDLLSFLCASLFPIRRDLVGSGPVVCTVGAYSSSNAFASVFIAAASTTLLPIRIR